MTESNQWLPGQGGGGKDALHKGTQRRLQVQGVPWAGAPVPAELQRVSACSLLHRNHSSIILSVYVRGEAVL